MSTPPKHEPRYTGPMLDTILKVTAYTALTLAITAFWVFLILGCTLLITWIF